MYIIIYIIIYITLYYIIYNLQKRKSQSNHLQREVGSCLDTAVKTSPGWSPNGRVLGPSEAASVSVTRERCSTSVIAYKHFRESSIWIIYGLYCT